MIYVIDILAYLRACVYQTVMLPRCRSLCAFSEAHSEETDVSDAVRAVVGEDHNVSDIETS